MPSASVLSTSMVFPAIEVIMSPGFVAFPLGMFSVSGVTTTMLMGSLSLAMATMDDRTVAAPPISAGIPTASQYRSSCKDHCKSSRPRRITSHS